MKFEGRAPGIDETQVEPEASALQVIDLQPFAFDIEAAVETARPEKTSAALVQVQSGAASSEALLAWIDDLREPEQQPSDVDPSDQQEGVIPDFMKDTQFAAGAANTPPPSGNAEIETPPHSDDDYFFSAVRRRRLNDDRLASPLDADATMEDDDDKVKSRA